MKRHTGRLVGWVGLLVIACGPPTEPATPSSASDLESTEDSDVSEAVFRGEEAIKKEDFETAKTVFTQILSRQPKHGKANHYLGVALENLGDAAGAEKHYRAALSIAPGLTDAALNLSALLIDQQKYDEAVKVLEESSKSNPKDPALQINLAYARMGMNDMKGAREAFEAALKLEDDPSARLGLAELEIAQDRFEQAVPHIDKAVAKSPQNLDILAPSAELYRRAHATDACIRTYDQAIALRPVAQLFANRGVCKQTKKDNIGAKQDYQKAIELDSTYAPAHFLYGRFLLTVEKNKKAAIEAFETCARVAPDSKCKQAAEDAANQR